ncbi:hypothetical protein Scep_027592 [Stephania cephalantha]|uniref:Uncharacterized protein n=1 Tax=Stephania cephalantha TaxID=152367 RepID=A0AAP0E880_9MAGN
MPTVYRLSSSSLHGFSLFSSSFLQFISLFCISLVKIFSPTTVLIEVKGCWCELAVVGVDGEF